MKLKLKPLKGGVVVGSILVLTSISVGAFAGTADALIENLRTKGVISEEEYKSLKEISGHEAEKAKNLSKKIENLFKENKIKKKYPVVKVEGRMQLDYRDHSPDATADLKGKPSQSIDVRRARLGGKIKLTDNAKAEIVLDIAEDDAVLDVGYLDYELPSGITMVLGKNKVDFSLEEMTSSRWIDFIERSMVNTYGGVGKNPQIGLKGTIGDIGGYKLMYASFDTNDSSDGKQIGFRGTVNMGEKNHSVYHLGLGMTKGDRAEGEVDRTYAGRGQKFFKASADIDTASGNYQHSRRGFELAVALGSLKVQYEHVTTGYSGIDATTNAGSFDKKIITSYLTLMYLVTGENYAKSYKTGAGKFDKIELNDKDKGAIEVGLRYSEFDGSDWDAGNGPRTATGYSSEAYSTTYGIKWIATPNIRFMLNYQVTDYENLVTTVNNQKKEKTWLTRAQFSF